MVTTVTNPAHLPEDDHTKRMKGWFLESLQELAKQLPIQADTEKTVVDIIANILIRNNVAVSEGIHNLWSQRLLRFAQVQSQRIVDNNPIAHLSPELQEKLHKRAEKAQTDKRSTGTADPAIHSGSLASFVVLGVDADTNEKIMLPDSERAGSVYVPGAARVGKSTLLVNMFTQDMQNGHGGAFLDPTGDTLPLVLSRIPKQRLSHVIFIEPGAMANPIALNLLARTNNATIDFDANRLMGIFKRVWGPTNWGPRLETYLRSSIYTLLHNGMTLAELPLLLKVKLFREKALNAIPDADRWVPFFWEYDFNKLSEYLQAENSDSTLNKVYQLLTIKEVEYVVSQRQTTLDLRQAMDEKKIILLSLSKHLIGEDAMKFLGTIFVSELFNAARSRADVSEEKRPMFSVYIDEFHNFLSPLFSQALAELGKYQINMVLSHQFLDQLDKETQGAALQIATTITFRVNPEDASTLAPFYAKEPTVEYREQEKKLPDSKPFDWFLSGHTHANPTVNEFVNNRLHPLHVLLISENPFQYVPYMFGNRILDWERQRNEQKDVFRDIKTRFQTALNNLFYQAMTNADPLSVCSQYVGPLLRLYLLNSAPFSLVQTIYKHPPKLHIMRVGYATEPRNTYSHTFMDSSPNLRRLGDSSTTLGFPLPTLTQEQLYQYETLAVEETMANAIAAMIRAVDDNQFQQASARFLSLAEQKLRNLITTHLPAYKKTYDEWVPIVKNAVKGLKPERSDDELFKDGNRWYNLENVNKLLPPEQEKKRCERELQGWMKELQALVAFIRVFRAFILALAHEPILVSSGQYEMVEAGRRSVQDMVNDAAQVLVSLPSRQAYVKRGASDDTPVKIHTLPLLPGCDAKELQERLLQVRTNTLIYGREKKDLEQELQQRQKDYLRGIVPSSVTITEVPDTQEEKPVQTASIDTSSVLARRSQTFTPSHTPIVTIPDSTSDADLLTLLSLLPYLSILQIGRVLQKEGSINNSLRPKVKKLVEAKLLDAVQVSSKKQGKSPYLYTLSAKGRNTLPQKPEALTVPSQFLEHTTLCNQMLVASSLLTKQIPDIHLLNLEHELLLKKKPIPLRRSDTLNPDGFVSYTLMPPFGLPGEPVAICFEIDNNANESEPQVREKLEKYLYAATGTYQEHFGIGNLTVAFCVPGNNTKRVEELRKIAEKVLHQHKEYASLFLFGSFDFTDLDPITVFTTPQWHTPFTTTLQTLIEKRA